MDSKNSKNRNKKGSVIGWNTDVINGSSMSISFSMSSQLWINLSITDDIKKYIVGTTTVKIGRKYNYIDLYEKL